MEGLSVAELIERRFDEHHPWRLALVQRDLVWDEGRMSNLLDSLLAGYPIGSLLVCRVRGKSFVLEESGKTRIAATAGHDTWQLLDGQQRIHAMTCLFTDRGDNGTFYLDMTKPRNPDEVVTGRRDARRIVEYVEWRPEGDGAQEPVVPRGKFLRLAGVHEWARHSRSEKIAALADVVEADPKSAMEVLREIDPEFVGDLSGPDLEVATKRTSRLLRAWGVRSIPIQRFTVDRPTEVLQVFTRINLAGVQLAGEDVFFAAVKTLWTNAEEHLDRVAANTPLLDRVAALRLLARLASLALFTDDLLPLRVERLNGEKGRQLIRRMEQLAAEGSPVLARIGVLGRVLTTKSVLGYGLTAIDSGLFDHVFAWAAVHPNGHDAAVVERDLQVVEAYLLGARAFRYATIFRDGFLRLGFVEALAAGARGESFPLRRIVAGVRRRWEGLKMGRSVVASIDTDDLRMQLVDQNVELFLSIVQRIPYEMPLRDPADPGAGSRRVEWDHIFPQARADAMRVPHPETNYLVHHAHRRLVWHAGNLWALDAPINNRASDSPPSKKFELLRSLPDAATGIASSWPATDQEALSDQERNLVLAAEVALDFKDIERAMLHFRKYVEGRALRIFRSVFHRIGDVTLFSPSSNADSTFPEDAALPELTPLLGLEPDPLVLADVPTVVPDSVVEEPFRSVYALADRAGFGGQLRMLVTLARYLGLVARPYPASVMFAPPANKARMLFTLWPRASKGGTLTIYRSAAAIHQFYPEISEEDARTALGEDGEALLARDEVPAFADSLRALFGAQTSLEG